MPDEIKQRITVEADDAIAKVGQMVKAEQSLIQATDKSGVVADAAGKKIDARKQGLGELRENIASLETAEQAHTRAVQRALREDEEATAKAEQRRQKLGELNQSLGQVTVAEHQAGDAAQEMGNEQRNAASGLDSELAAMAEGFVGVAAIIGTIRQGLQRVRQDIEENTHATREFAEASLNLQFLSQEFKPGEREFVGKASAVAGRSPVETAGAFADLKSRFPQLDDQAVQAMMLEVAETAKTTPAPLSAVVNAYSTIRQYESDPQKAQNILRASIIQSGVSDPGKISPLFAKFMGTGTSIGNMSAGQAAGSVAAVTGLGLNPDEAVTGLRNVVLSLAGNGDPEGNLVLTREGIDRKDVFHALRQISEKAKAGKIANKELESIAGREGVAVMAALADPERLGRFLASVNAVSDAQTSTHDLTKEAINQQFAADPQAALNYAIKWTDAQVSMRKANDTEAMQFQLMRNLNDLRLRACLESNH